MRLSYPSIAHGAVVLLGVLAVVTSAHAAKRYAGISFFPPEPRTLVPASATAYLPLAGDRPEATARALDDLAAVTGIRRGTLVAGTTLIGTLGDHMGVARWDAGAHPRSLALIAQVKISDVVALTGDPAVKRRVGELRRGLSVRVAYVYRDVKVYRVRFQNGGGGYACLVAGDAVFATDPATANRVISANG